MTLVAEKDLVVGSKYYLDTHHKDTGEFVKASGEMIFFKPLAGKQYLRNKKGLIVFILSGDYFETI